MITERLNVTYNTFKELVGKVPIFYLQKNEEEGFYELYATGEDQLIICGITSSGDNTHFSSTLMSSASLVSSIDDAVVLGRIKNKIPFNKSYQSDKALTVAVVGTEGSETIWATHNYADKTTWFSDSIRVTETLFNSGDNLTFSGSFTHWIDMDHGKVFDEDGLKEDVEHGYSIVVVVDNVTKSMIEPFFEAVSGSAGDYFVNYKSGSITFVSETTGSVTCTYSYASGSTWYLRPTTGKTIDIVQAETQFSENVEFNDSIRFVIYGYVDVFAPAYSQANGGPLPVGTLIPIEETKYKSMYQMIDEALGSYPVVPSIGGVGSRGMSTAVYGFPFTYNALRRLDGRYGMELRVFLEHNLEFGGSRATGTFYCLSKPVSELE